MGYNTGLKNERQIIEYLNNKMFRYLNINMQRFIGYLFPGINDDRIIYCKKLANHAKGDIEIRSGSLKMIVSIKSGNGNSVHTERVSDFYKFLRSLGVDDMTLKFMLFYHFGDGTLNGTGLKRRDVSYLKTHFQDHIDEANDILNQKHIVEAVINRTLFGANNAVDFIYCGDVNSGVFASQNTIREYLLNNLNKKIPCLHFSELTYQPLKRCIYSKVDDYKRYFIEIKWYTCKNNLTCVCNMYKDILNQKKYLDSLFENSII